MTKVICINCGSEMYGQRCKLKCPNCGLQEDCSDAGLIDYERVETTPRGPSGEEPSSVQPETTDPAD